MFLLILISEPNDLFPSTRSAIQVRRPIIYEAVVFGTHVLNPRSQLRPTTTWVYLHKYSPHNTAKNSISTRMITGHEAFSKLHDHTSASENRLQYAWSYQSAINSIKTPRVHSRLQILNPFHRSRLSKDKQAWQCHVDAWEVHDELFCVYSSDWRIAGERATNWRIRIKWRSRQARDLGSAGTTKGNTKTRVIGFASYVLRWVWCGVSCSAHSARLGGVGLISTLSSAVASSSQWGFSLGEPHWKRLCSSNGTLQIFFPPAVALNWGAKYDLLFAWFDFLGNRLQYSWTCPINILFWQILLIRYIVIGGKTLLQSNLLPGPRLASICRCCIVGACFDDSSWSKSPLRIGSL